MKMSANPEWFMFQQKPALVGTAITVLLLHGESALAGLFKREGGSSIQDSKSARKTSPFRSTVGQQLGETVPEHERQPILLASRL